MVVDKIEHHNTDNDVYSNREYVFQNVEKDEDYLQKTVSNVKENDARSESVFGKAKISDQKLCDLLEKQGIKIARRTVAKYRAELNIQSSYDR